MNSDFETYASLTDSQLRNRLDPANGIVIVESPKVINTALDCGLEPLSLLCEERHITGDAAGIIARCPGLKVLTAPRQELEQLTGYRLTRGVLSAMRRPVQPTAESVLQGARRVVVINSVCDTTNIGAIFRSAAALGMDGILLTPDSCDPYNRRAVRVSMGTVFQIPWAWLPQGNPAAWLNENGWATAAMALRADSVNITDAQLNAEPHLALIFGTEGEGLPDTTISSSKYTVCIPMYRGVDSLNVSNAAAIAIFAVMNH